MGMELLLKLKTIKNNFMRTKNINIENIKEGYFWESDKSAPIIIDGNVDKSGISKLEYGEYSNPFLIEAQYVDEDECSHSIKYVDGYYIEVKTNLKELKQKPESFDLFEFNGHRMNGRVLQFARVWSPDTDVQCVGMSVYKFDRMVFLGFKK